ncbi:MAG TPA: hydantoinase B/oxoprolinase family protein, partial [Burkholderiales bacterium]|nr:hydantoinase B/oxoprolinase family protein [Burkholderiales bacterium]
PPWGLNGGLPAKGNQIGLHKKDGSRNFFPNGKVNTRLDAGDAYILRSGGGGGFGDPKQRKRESVLRDLRLGYISRQAAERDYGIQLSDAELAALPPQHRTSDEGADA